MPIESISPAVIPTTLICIVLDSSGSMYNNVQDTIGGFNAFLDEQKSRTEQNIKLYLILFNTVVKIVHRNVPLHKVSQLSKETYLPRGHTALYDAIAQALRVVDEDNKNNDSVICVIMTDGKENSSRYTSKEQIQEQVRMKEKEANWTFLYIGEEPHRWTEEMCSPHTHTIIFDHKNAYNNFALLSGSVAALLSSTFESIEDSVSLSQIHKNPAV
ncbi:von Willebrand factor type A-like protein [Leptotrombidium deliense]|uniref:von Willebrand factor type A-like protein n=1 Tax=Leptotrombidium deliense TaxID=299467 RepID=A0A443SJX0_9ACAR|nr:von Willebrand factor type A-like protein [Leptotrombidium deliense]